MIRQDVIMTSLKVLLCQLSGEIINKNCVKISGSLAKI